MAEANQYVLSNKELLETLIKHVGVHEGRWGLLVNFGVATGGFGPKPEEVGPGIAVIMSQVGIQRAEPNAPPGMSPGLVVDAAEINPKPKAGR